MSRLMRDGTAEPISRDQIIRHERGQGNIHFPCSADHVQDWQPYPVDSTLAICVTIDNPYSFWGIGPLPSEIALLSICDILGLTLTPRHTIDSVSDSLTAEGVKRLWEVS